MSDSPTPDSTSNDGLDTLKRFWTIQDDGDYSLQAPSGTLLAGLKFSF